jgi:exodeoxyribonuclease V beta subunit
MQEFNLLNQPLQLGDQLLIEASAGTGKTTTLENIILRLLLEGIRVPGSEKRKLIALPEILVVTFTEAATAELIQRVRSNIALALDLLHQTDMLDQNSELAAKILQNYLQNSNLPTLEAINLAKLRLRMALLSFDESSIATIHGFCSKMLNEFAFESELRFDLELIEDEKNFLTETVQDYWRGEFYEKEEHFFAAIAAHSKLTIDSLCSTLSKLKSAPLAKLPHSGFNLSEAKENLKSCFQATKKNLSQAAKLKLLCENANNFKIESSKKILSFAASVENSSSNDNIVFLTQLLLLQPQKLKSNLKRRIKWINVVDNDINTGQLPFEFEQIFTHLELFEQAKNDYLLALRLDCIDFALTKGELASKKANAGVQSFDDLLLGMFAAVQKKTNFCQKVRKRFPVVLIDEFQDTDPLQFMIFDRIFNSPKALMVMVGDPKQSIYQFRGADIYAYLQVAKKLPVENLSTLSCNYRSTPELLAAFNKVFDINNPFIENAIKYTPAQAGREQAKLIVKNSSYLASPFQVFELDGLNGKALNQQDAFNYSMQGMCGVVSNILALAASKDKNNKAQARFENKDGSWRQVAANDIAILTQSNHEAQSICQYLSSLGIPAVLQNSGNIFESDAATDLYHILSAIEQPLRSSKVLTALSTLPFSFDFNFLATLATDSEKLAAYQQYFAMLLKLWQENNFVRMFYFLLSSYHDSNIDCDIRSTVLAQEQGERYLTDLLHLGELLHKKSLKEHFGITKLLAYLQQQITLKEQNSEHERRLESSDAAVKVMTVHKSKGLQFGLVFCTSLWKLGGGTSSSQAQTNFFYHKLDKNGNFEQHFDFGLANDDFDQNCEISRKEQLTESIRLIYVALTRAKNYCAISCGNIQKIKQSALAYLIEEYSSEELELFFKSKKSKEQLDYKRWQECKYINFVTPEMEENKLSKNNSKQHKLSLPSSYAAVPKDWGMLSFSSLTANSNHHDSSKGQHFDSTNLKKDALPLGDFPKGAISGDCIHQIFERVDFSLLKQDSWQENRTIKQIVQDRLIAMNRVSGARNSLEYEHSLNERREQIYTMLESVLRAPLCGADDVFRLCDLESNDYLPELEFYFPVIESIGYQKLNYIIKLVSGKQGELMSAADAKPVRGFMNGLIDLTFVVNNRFYIIDWKSNHLGDAFADYTKEKLATCMYESNYYLQVAIYMYALDKYLSLRLDNYSFDQHFGGAFYLFIRGMTKDNLESGVYNLNITEQALSKIKGIFEANCTSSTNKAMAK